MSLVLRELVMTYRTTPARLDRATLTDPRAAARIACQLLEGEPVEVFGAIMLNAASGALCWREISRGGLSATVVRPRDVFLAAVHANAHSLILAHNHPSGRTSPSPDDRALTTRLQQAGELLGIGIVDHIIVGESGAYSSFKEMGLL